MNKLNRSLVVALSLTSAASFSAETTGNRYGYPVLYKSEISAASAWLQASKKAKKQPVILDVRRIEEFVAGHPVNAYSIPFPHITGSPAKANDTGGSYLGYDISGDPDVGFIAVDGKDGAIPIQEWVSYVESVFPDKEQPIYLVCATGHRSVQAGNALAKYGKYVNVYNVWEGYNGQPKYAYTGDKPKQPLVALDLNNDGIVDAKDRDGWAFYQGLPIATKIIKKRIQTTYQDRYVSPVVPLVK